MNSPEIVRDDWASKGGWFYVKVGDFSIHASKAQIFGKDSCQKLILMENGG